MPGFGNANRNKAVPAPTHDRAGSVQAALEQHRYEQQVSLGKFLDTVAHIYDGHIQTNVNALAIGYPCEASTNDVIVEQALESVIPQSQHTLRQSYSSTGSPRSTSPRGTSKIESRRTESIEQSHTSATIRVHVCQASGLRAADWHLLSQGTSDPYCVIEMRGRKDRFQTKVVQKTLNPTWNQVFEFRDVGDEDDLVFSVFDHDWSKADDFLGTAKLQVQQFLPDGFEGEIALENSGTDNAIIWVRVEVVLEVVSEAFDRRRNKLTKWWSALVGGSGVKTSMTAKKLAQLVAQTQHPNDRLDSDAIGNVLSSVICQSGSEALEEDEWMTNESHEDELTFGKFSALVLWRGTQQFKKRTHPELIRDAYIVRDSLVKAAADRMIAKHARLQCVDEDSAGSRSQALAVLEPVAGAVILLNGLTIGISADLDEWEGWKILEIFFTAFFLFEIIAKLYIFGVSMYFFGPDWKWHFFDTIVVGFAMMDVFVTNFVAGNKSFLRDFTLVRMTRLARLSRLMRLLRLLRLKVFKELLLMIKGIYAGIRTLFWAVVLLLLIVYVLSMVLRQTVGESNFRLGGRALFTDVFSTMFTVFRVFLGDTDLADGTPLAYHMYLKYGVVFAVPYCLVILFIVFGIFNMIAALFVENVIATANAKKTLSVTGERIRVARRLRFLLLKFAGHKQGATGKSITAQVTEVYKISTSRWYRILRGLCRKTTTRLRMSRVGDDGAWQSKWFDLMAEGSCSSGLDTVVTRDNFTRLVQEPEVQDAFDDLEIYTADRGELFDVLDADGSGEIDLSELIAGLMKLRSSGGDRSDAVATVLGIKSMQAALSELRESVGRLGQTPVKKPASVSVLNGSKEQSASDGQRITGRRVSTGRDDSQWPMAL